MTCRRDAAYAELQLACDSLERACAELRSLHAASPEIADGGSMRTVAILSQKGGSGKTTLAVHLAVEAALAGFRVSLLDLDPQASAQKWSSRRQTGEPNVIGDHAERLPRIKTAAQATGTELLLIDTAPNADRAGLAAAHAADLVLIPCRPAFFDLEAVDATRDLADLACKPSFVVLSSAPIRSNIVADARQGLEEKGVRVAPQPIFQRVVYAHSVIDGQTAAEIERDSKAATEMSTLFEWMRDVVELSPARVRPAAGCSAA